MTGFEYKVVPAPTRGLKAKGIKGTQARFANALEVLMNELGAYGWDYQRTDTLPVEERQGLTGKTTTFQTMLVFRRALSDREALRAEEPVTALIEDQTEEAAGEEIAAEGNTEDDIAAPSDVAPETETADEAVPSAQTRVSETLKAESFTFPWNKRDKAPRDTVDPQRPAE
ncbi:DUF4177 domain-containing protein [Pseudooctadecabacter jejudonensis]|uniref:DUF4177 domain-containing protein n=1 Tax=Pseudooctadecabacter jejudonensis TaxID=1391910 RepID=A0A1Y5RKI7_9RHOB|nr:DUF4177 domain-containing protein [Pseudooctadecabacter jejudonensis]SLN19623.1 hypothetical protein PSJ8397_00698 [Pseudooctadecabacter jejudonensis]